MVQKRLADEHKTAESRGVVGQVSGLVSLLLALVLGTLVGVSFSFFSNQKTQLENFSAQILRLDQALAQYGPETKPARDKLKEAIVTGYETFWGGGKPDHNALTVGWPLQAQRMTDYLTSLQPKTEAQKQALATANQYGSMVEQTRLLTALQVASQPVSWYLLAILVFWTVALFFAIGLYATPNTLVVTALTFGAFFDRLRDLPDLATRPALYRPLPGFARRAPAGDRVRRQVGGRRVCESLGTFTRGAVDVAVDAVTVPALIADPTKNEQAIDVADSVALTK